MKKLSAGNDELQKNSPVPSREGGGDEEIVTVEMAGGGEPTSSSHHQRHQQTGSGENVENCPSDGKQAGNSDNGKDVSKSKSKTKRDKNATGKDFVAMVDERELLHRRELKYGAEHVINLFVPVSICMALVIFTIYTLGYYSDNQGVHLIYTPFIAERDAAAGTQLLFSLGNAAVMIGFVAVMTCLMIALYKWRCYRLIHGWLFLSTLMLLSLFSGVYVQELLKHWNAPADYLSVLFVIWNWAAMGIICIHWRGPLLLQQAYLISVAALLALVFIKYLPEWTVWTVLGALSLWDLVAVLCPHGPLRILVETAQRRNEPLFPALIYSSGMVWYAPLLPTLSISTASTLFTAVATTNDEENMEEEINNREGEENAGEENDNFNHANDRGGMPQTAAQNPPFSSASSTSGGNGNGGNSSDSTTALLRGGGNPREATVRFAPARPSGASAGEDTAIVTIHQQQPQQRNNNRNNERQGQNQHPGAARLNNGHGVGDHDREVEHEGVKLGLGDFIFYSVLVGRASAYGDWNTTLACYIAILVGLAFTLMLLAIIRRALPALPISIGAGILFFFATREVITPFVTEVARHQYLL